MFGLIVNCRLSACFRASKYPQRPSTAKTLGIVIHEGHELLAKEAPNWPSSRSEADSRRFARDLFDGLLERHRADVEDQERTVKLNWVTDRISDARSAFIISSTSFLTSSSEKLSSARPVRERTLTSADGVVTGTPDLVLSDGGSVTMVDLKTGTLDERGRERYENQIHIYAYAYESVYGIWPSHGILRNPSTGREIRFPIDPKKAEGLIAQASKEVDRIAAEQQMAQLAQTGEACRNCDYRPWCDPYWRSEHDQSDFAGSVTEIAATLDDDTRRSNGWVTIKSEEGEETFLIRDGPALLAGLNPGDKVRGIDTFTPNESALKVITAFSEVFVL